MRRVYETIVTVRNQNILYIPVHVCVCVRCRAWVSACWYVRVVGDVEARGRTYAFTRACLLIHDGTRMRHVACGLFGSSRFFDIIPQMTRFSEKRF